MKTSDNLKFKNHELFQLIHELNKKDGPDTHEYEHLNACINSIPLLLQQKTLNDSDLETIKEKLQFINTDSTIIGHAKLKPFGYAGDYLIIDKIYQEKISEKYFKWDHYSMTNPAAQAVRNRKQFFKNLIHSKLQKQQTVRLLNVASGPARDLKEIYDEIDQNRLITTCVEMDMNAIAYAKSLCTDYLEQIEFVNKNVFKFRTNEKFDLIWSAGLFDYFNDETFVQLIKRFKGYLIDNGEIVIGNFSTNNPSRVFMEIFGEWFLHHRSADELLKLAIESGVDKNKMFVDQEPLGVNLFLRINHQKTAILPINDKHQLINAA